ncbi:glycosyltransferase family 2 protein [Chryseobacterium balustinum]|uniref:Chondroitin polymerase n=1 Tax=Chryseobacterium balustinum TaxID=246 RepID=A0AAX2IH72_9FLAO|nr:glycosyltransferase [Chryseobacterium balustinum]AZB31071.1 glycosyltransferase [Chryseobacterium balustinum]SKB40669.1 Glycosyl transferase family 2 [Chryseobacterium balustinum]SQA87787.1 Chondroitin polymerase [Chryseobacterium balustinum]
MAENLKVPKISVIMPVYNGEKYLKEAIDSILKQTFANFELLLINDGSTDLTEAIIGSYDDERIVYIKNEKNLGLIKTLNKGLDLAKGEFIARMDQDDISHSERFEKQLIIFEKNTEIGVCGTLFTPFNNSNNKEYNTIEHPELHKSIKIQLLALCIVGHPTIMMRKNAVGNFRYDESFQAAEDYELWTRLVTSTQFYNIQESLLQYRIHDTNMSVLENSTQVNNAKKITGNQLKNIGIENSDFNIEQCQILLGAVDRFRLSDDELRKLIIFANHLESKNGQQKIYDIEELHKIVQQKLLQALRKTVNKKLSTFSFLLKNRREIITQRNIITNIKMLGKMILKQ